MRPWRDYGLAVLAAMAIGAFVHFVLSGDGFGGGKGPTTAEWRAQHEAP